MKNYYIAVTIRLDNKLASFVHKMSSNNNLLSLTDNTHVICAMICESKKNADFITNYWNQIYKEENRYLYE